jgi:general secretion pathway protein E
MTVSAELRGATFSVAPERQRMRTRRVVVVTAGVLALLLLSALVGAAEPVAQKQAQDTRTQLDQGFFFSLWKLALTILYAFIWFLSVDWVNKDSKFVEERQTMWNALMLVCGALGLGFLMIVPLFGVAYLLALTAYGIPIGSYVSVRNQKVTEDLKVLTSHHFDVLWRRLTAKFGGRAKPVEVKEQVGAPVDFYNKDGTPAFADVQPTPTGVEGGESAAVLALRELVYEAIKSRATDIHLEPKGQQVAVRLRIDGILHPTEAFDRELGTHVLQAVKVMSGMDIAERRKPQDGNFSCIVEERTIDVRAATAGQLGGEKMALRLLDQKEALLRLDGLGLSKKMEERVRDLAKQPHGLLIVSGPTGSGKTTTLYACLSELDAFQRNIVTLENPIEYHLTNISQRAIDLKAGITFAESLRSTLRQDPDVIMVGEIRDHETAEIAFQAATTGHMVFTSLHATDTVNSIFRLINLGLESYMIGSALTAVLSQRLVRVLCEHCKEAYKPKEEWLRKANLPPDKIDVFYKAVGCEACRGTGYFGRTGIFELLLMTDRMREICRDNPSLNDIKAEARKGGMLYLQEEGLKKVITGATSITELLRVTK